jgi:hypothetical protein
MVSGLEHSFVVFYTIQLKGFLITVNHLFSALRPGQEGRDFKSPHSDFAHRNSAVSRTQVGSFFSPANFKIIPGWASSDEVRQNSLKKR